MGKHKVMIEGKEVEVEVSNEEVIKKLTQDEIVDAIQIKEKGVIEKLFEKLGIKISEKKEKPEKKDEGKVVDELNLPPEVKKILEENQKTIESLTAQVGELKTENQTNAKQQSTKAAAEIIADGVKKGRIAKGEVETWNKKFETDFKGDVNLLKMFINTRPEDPNIRTANASDNTNPPALDADGKPIAGIRTYTRAEIAAMSKEEYKKERLEIVKAQAAGTITD